MSIKNSIVKHKPLTYGIKRPEIRKVAQGNPLLSEREVENIVVKILKETFQLVVRDVVKWINKFVAKRTGQLRENLILNLASSRTKNYTMVFVLLTSINYAEQVVNYKTSQVRHKNSKREHYTVTYMRKGRGKKKIGKGKVTKHPYAYANYGGHSGRITLNDPQAITNFFTMMVRYTVKSILINLKIIKRKYSAKTKMKFKEMRIIKMW